MWGKFEVIPGDILPLASECCNKVGRFLVKKCSFVLFLVVGIVVVVVVVQKRTTKKLLFQLLLFMLLMLLLTVFCYKFF